MNAFTNIQASFVLMAFILSLKHTSAYVHIYLLIVLEFCFANFALYRCDPLVYDATNVNRSFVGEVV